MSLDERVARAAECVLEYVQPRPGEIVLLLSDRFVEPAIVRTILDRLDVRGIETVHMLMPESGFDQLDLPPPVARALRGADVVISNTRATIMHRPCITEALYLSGCRGIEVHADNLEQFTHPWMLVRPSLLEEIVYRVEEAIGDARVLYVRATNGTDFSSEFEPINVGGQPGHGHGREPGTWVHWPHGEIYLMPPVDGASNGTLVLDVVKTLKGFFRPAKPVRFEIENCLVTAVEGSSEEAEDIRRQLATFENDDCFVEAALGLNPAIPHDVGRNLYYFLRRAGVAYFGFGNSKVGGGRIRAPHHVDHIVLYPTVTFDGREVVRDGILLPLQEMALSGRYPELEPLLARSGSR